jgi:hypothetical protein
MAQTVQQGWSEQTAAVRQTILRGLGGGGARGVRRRVKRKAKKAASGVRRRVKRSRSVKGLRKGSAAMKRHMAKLRGMRKR